MTLQTMSPHGGNGPAWGVRRPLRPRPLHRVVAGVHAVCLVLAVSVGGLVGLVLPFGPGMAALIAGAASAGVVLLAAGPSAGRRLDRCLRRSVGAVPSSVPFPGTRSGRGLLAAWRRRPDPLPAGLPVPVVIDLVASVVEAGAPPETAVRLVSRSLRGAGNPAAAGLAEHPDPTPQWRPLFAALQLARSVGLGPVGLLRSAAAEQRRRRAEALAVAARRLAVLAVLPTSLCLLPAFVLLTVVPLVLGLFPS